MTDTVLAARQTAATPPPALSPRRARLQNLAMISHPEPGTSTLTETSPVYRLV
jgi:hypothetical protein